jgi:hypothetical protein
LGSGSLGVGRRAVEVVRLQVHHGHPGQLGQVDGWRRVPRYGSGGWLTCAGTANVIKSDLAPHQLHRVIKCYIVKIVQL